MFLVAVVRKVEPFKKEQKMPASQILDNGVDANMFTGVDDVIVSTSTLMKVMAFTPDNSYNNKSGFGLSCSFPGFVRRFFCTW